MKSAHSTQPEPAGFLTERKMKSPGKALLPLMVAALLASLVTGCSSGVKYTNIPPGTVRTLEEPSQSAVVESEKVEIPVYGDEEPSLQYKAGPGDVLLVSVFGRPDFGSPILVNGQVQGSRVDGNGRIQLPMLGSIEVGENTTEEIRAKIEKLLSQYLREPSVTVEVLSYGSKQISLLGQFNAPGAYYLDRPTRLLQALAQGKGLKDNADLKSARLVRDQKVLPVDIYALVREGEIANNIWIRPGDTVFVPQQMGRRVYVFGAVKRPGPIDIPEDQKAINLTQAVAFAGLSDTNYEEQHIRIIRSRSATKGELMVVDLKKILDGEALPFMLVENDIVFVPKGELGEWNQAIAEMMPTLQAVGAFLQPFVQIRLLTSGR